MKSTPKMTIANYIKCPCCGSDMKRDKSDSPHNRYVGHYTCQNQQCTISATVRN